MTGEGDPQRRERDAAARDRQVDRVACGKARWATGLLRGRPLAVLVLVAVLALAVALAVGAFG